LTAEEKFETLAATTTTTTKGFICLNTATRKCSEVAAGMTITAPVTDPNGNYSAQTILKQWSDYAFLMRPSDPKAQTTLDNSFSAMGLTAVNPHEPEIWLLPYCEPQQQQQVEQMTIDTMQPQSQVQQDIDEVYAILDADNTCKPSFQVQLPQPQAPQQQQTQALTSDNLTRYRQRTISNSSFEDDTAASSIATPLIPNPPNHPSYPGSTSVTAPPPVVVEDVIECQPTSSLMEWAATLDVPQTGFGKPDAGISLEATRFLVDWESRMQQQPQQAIQRQPPYVPDIESNNAMDALALDLISSMSDDNSAGKSSEDNGNSNTKGRRRSLKRKSPAPTTDSEQEQTTSGAPSPTSNDQEVPNKTTTATATRKRRRKPASEMKKFICPRDECKKVFTKRSHFSAHIRAHNGERPFACDYAGCSARYIRSDELRRHKRSHTGYKPHACDVCNYAFARSDHLKTHRKTHFRDQ
jgi:hypothetical protein